MKLTTDHIRVIRSFPGQGVHTYGKDINAACKFKNWDAPSHPGWETWKILRDLKAWGIVEQLPRSGRYSVFVLL